MSDILSKEFVESYKNKHPKWGFNGLGYIVYKRTYSRVKPDGTTEEWYETIERCINGAQKIGARYTQQEAERLFDYIFNLKCNFAGRMLWQLGTTTVDRFGANSLLNCWFTSINEPNSFLFLFENLMLGGGVGFSVRREDIMELPKIKKGVIVTHQPIKDADFIVPDSREGWVKLLERVLNSYYITGKSFIYSTILVRGAGEKINGFGGKASGPTILVEGIEKISTIFKTRAGKKLRSIDVLDICNIIGSIVVSGNVRRSAEIAIGDPDDILYIRAKNWNTGTVPNWRSMSNNSLYVDDYSHLMDELWENGYKINPETGFSNGEPYGFFNLPLSQKFGRLKDGPMKDTTLYPTDYDNVIGTNPCAEISLSNYECCNLSELYLNNISTESELQDCSKLLYKTQKAIAALPFLHEETNKIVHKNMRLGLGVTGICQSIDKLSWLDDCYVELRKFDKIWSKELGVPESIKLTTIKPSGCVVPSTRIKTKFGILSFDEIFKENNINLSEKINERREWYDMTVAIKVLDKNGDWKRITKLFLNGREQTLKLTFDDGYRLECTPNHKFLLKSGDWKQAADLTYQDELDCTFTITQQSLKLINTEVCENFTVDCEVEDTHCYQLENGIVSHNTLSLLGGSTPGIHPAYSQYYMRTVRMSSSDTLVQTCKNLGYHVEFLLNFDGSENHDTVVVYFPCETPSGSTLAKDMNVIKQLEMVKKLQEIWSDNAVSVTAYYNPDELTELKAWLKQNYKDNIKSVSFLLHQNHGFKQAPYQEIDEETYLKAKEKVKPMTNLLISNGDLLSGIECDGGICPIR